MGDMISKFLAKLSDKQRDVINTVLIDIFNEKLDLYDVKKLVGSGNIYRIRKGNIRIIFVRSKSLTEVIHIGHRDDNTYSKF